MHTGVGESDHGGSSGELARALECHASMGIMRVRESLVGIIL